MYIGKESRLESNINNIRYKFSENKLHLTDNGMFWTWEENKVIFKNILASGV